MLHDFKLYRSTISKLITLLHNQETAKTNFANNCLILAMSTESTINYHKKTICLLYSANHFLFPHYTLFYYSTRKKNPFALYIYKSKKTIQKTLERNHLKKEKKHFKLCNRLSKFFEEARITRSIWNFTMS